MSANLIPLAVQCQQQSYDTIKLVCGQKQLNNFENIYFTVTDVYF